mmetsp:Transcript_53475/g.106389  ORF Transcript_53475/g.106389 Transcript_53475/m.106389 type:complete len:257 (-) Transcript_53475:152-922(-)
MLVSSPHLLQAYIHAEISTAQKAIANHHRVTNTPRAHLIPPVSAHAECWKSINGRAYQRWCDPTFDFSSYSTALPGGALAAPPATWSGGWRALWSTPPEWMLPRVLGAWGGLSSAEEAAEAEASVWRGRGYVVECFVDAAGRPAFRDRILTSSGYREAMLICTHGTCTFTPDAPLTSAPPPAATRGVQRKAVDAEVVLRAGKWTNLVIGRWHAVGNGAPPVSPAAVSGQRDVEGPRGVGGEAWADELVASWAYVMR